MFWAQKFRSKHNNDDEDQRPWLHFSSLILLIVSAWCFSDEQLSVSCVLQNRMDFRSENIWWKEYDWWGSNKINKKRKIFVWRWTSEVLISCTSAALHQFFIWDCSDCILTSCPALVPFEIFNFNKASCTCGQETMKRMFNVRFPLKSRAILVSMLD